MTTEPSKASEPKVREEWGVMFGSLVYIFPTEAFARFISTGYPGETPVVRRTVTTTNWEQP